MAGMIQTHAAVAVLALLLGAGSAWQVQDWRHEAREAQRLEAEREASGAAGEAGRQRSGQPRDEARADRGRGAFDCSPR